MSAPNQQHNDGQQVPKKSFNQQLLAARPANRDPASLSYDTPSSQSTGILPINHSIQSQPIGMGLTSLQGSMNDQHIMRSSIILPHQQQTEHASAFGHMHLNVKGDSMSSSGFGAVPSKADLLQSAFKPVPINLTPSLTTEQLSITQRLAVPMNVPGQVEPIFAFQVQLLDDSKDGASSSSVATHTRILQSIIDCLNTIQVSSSASAATAAADNYTIDMSLSPNQHKLIVAAYHKHHSCVFHLQLYKIDSAAGSSTSTSNEDVYLIELQRRASTSIDTFTSLFNRLLESMRNRSEFLVSSVLTSSSALAQQRHTTKPHHSRHTSFEQHLAREDEQAWRQQLNSTSNSAASVEVQRDTLTHLLSDAGSDQHSLEKRKEALSHLCDIFDSTAIPPVAQLYAQLLIADSTLFAQLEPTLLAVLSLFDCGALRLAALWLQSLAQTSSQLRTALSQSASLQSAIEKALAHMETQMSASRNALLSAPSAASPASLERLSSDSHCLYMEPVRQLQATLELCSA